MTEKTELLPCPFCGGEAEVKYRSNEFADHPNDRSPTWDVFCKRCDCGFYDCVSQERATAVWQDRHTPSQSESIKRCLRILEDVKNDPIDDVMCKINIGEIEIIEKALLTKTPENVSKPDVSEALEAFDALEQAYINHIEETLAAELPDDDETFSLIYQASRTIRQALTAQSVDVEALAKDLERNELKGSFFPIRETIKALIERGYLQQGWQPIETAPRDGTEVQVWYKGLSVLMSGYFISKDYLEKEYGDPDYMEEGWYPSASYPDGWEYVIEPTHWKPIGALPEGKE